MTAFWRNWLAIWCGSVVVSGVVLALGALEATHAPTRWFLELVGGDPDYGFDATAKFLVGVMGPLTMGWGLVAFGAIKAAEMLGDRGVVIWRWTLAGVTCWFVCDSSMSIATGFPLNVLPNIVIYAAFVLPLIATGVLRKA